MFSARQFVPCWAVVDLGGGECANRMCCQQAAVAVRPGGPHRSPPTALSRMLLQPRALVALLVADLGLLLFRVVAVVDAYLLGRRDGRPASAGWRRGAAAGLVVVLGVTAAPHAAA